jgi:Acetyl-coenzyme A synthetase N-terminus
LTALLHFDVASARTTERRTGRFDDVYRRSLDAPETFWAEAAAALDWIEPCDRVRDDSEAPFYRWFRGRRLKGQLPVGVLVLKAGSLERMSTSAKRRCGSGAHRAGRCVQDRDRRGAPAEDAFRKIMRRIADGEKYRMPATIDDRAILGATHDALPALARRLRKRQPVRADRGRAARHRPPSPAAGAVDRSTRAASASRAVRRSGRTCGTSS